MNRDTLLHPEQSPVIQPFGSPVPVRLELTEQIRHRSLAARLEVPHQSVSPPIKLQGTFE
jgi:hypothetical protein